MHAFSRWVALATLVSGVAAHADPYDLRITKLGNPDANEANSSASANSDFQAFARAMAATLTSTTLTPPKTLGHAGWNVNAELSVVSLPAEDSVRLPMEDPQPGTMLLPSVHVRKGLPFSMELGTRVAWVEKSKMLAATGEFKWAIHEGFTVVDSPEENSILETLIQYTPDLAVRGHVTRLVGVRDLSLTAGGADLSVGKAFTFGNMVTLTPYGGLDFSFVGASSNNLDFNPNRPYNETLENNSLAALEDTSVYRRVRFSKNMTQRAYGGARFVGGPLQLGAEISFTRLGAVPVNPLDENSETRGLPTLVTFNTSLGLDF
jgi:hypothetical protein